MDSQGTEKPLHGKKALVLGASKGLGFACAKNLYEAGANVVLNSRNLVNLELARDRIRFAQSGPEIYIAPFDINDKIQIRDGMNRVLEMCDKGVDILVTNSANFSYGPFLDLIDEDWDTAITLKFKSIVRVVRRILPGMIENKYGRIVNIGSIDTKEPQFGFTPSVSARLLAMGYLKSLADHVASKGIRVNQVLCGYTATETLMSYLEKKAAIKGTDKDVLEQQITDRIPMRRFADPDEIGRVVRFLVSEDASYITGQSIIVDGGLVRFPQ
jgi:NAD(P)-dependent dehydrogenase (short-subunit alcohol dehydrogenase family)